MIYLTQYPGLFKVRISTLKGAKEVARMWARRIGQVGLLVAISALGSALASWLHWSAFPGSLLGLGLLYAALQLGWLPLSWVEEGANWLLRHLLLFFVPSAVGILQYTGLLRFEGWGIATTIVASTALVMAVTGITIDGAHRIKQLVRAWRIARRRVGKACR